MSREAAIQPAIAKKMLKANRRVGKITKGIPDLISYTAELFIADLIEKLRTGDKEEVTLDQIVNAIETQKEYDFLLPLVPSIRDLQTEGGVKKTKERLV
jgi:hypothetical protein